MASRIRSGHRLPGLDTIERISKAYKIPMSALLKARRAGPQEFSRLIRKRVYREKTKVAA